MGVLLEILELAIEAADDPAALAGWWREHQWVLRRLDADQLARVVACKDRQKGLLIKGS